MLSESILKLVLTDGVEVRNVTHLGRGPTTAQKIALLWERPVCSRQGCGRRARLEYDHVDGYEYRTTRHTRLDELEPLCDPDHDLKTFQGWALVEAPASDPWSRPTTFDTLATPRRARPVAHDRGSSGASQKADIE